MKEGGGKWVLREGLTEEKGLVFLLGRIGLRIFMRNEAYRGGGFFRDLRRWETQRKWEIELWIGRY